MSNNTTEFTVFVESENVLYTFNSFEEMIREFEEEPIWNPEEELFEIRASEEELNENLNEELEDYWNDVVEGLPENDATVEEL